MSSVKTLSISKVTNETLIILGGLIRAARLEKGYSQTELASRINISRFTVMEIEKGRPTVAIGAVFEAAYLLNIPLVSENPIEPKKLRFTLSNLVTVLPKRVPQKPELPDDF